MNWALTAAIASPFIFGLANVFDKYVVSRKVKDPFSYAAVQGVAVMILGIIIASFFNWSGLSFYDMLFPALAGIFYGSVYYIYFFLMRNSDASYVTGFLFLFPIVVTFLSFLFLKERLSFVSYLAIFIILLGIVLLSARARKSNSRLLIWPLVLFVLAIGGYEFFVKITTDNITFMRGFAITTLVTGFTVLSGFVYGKVRNGFRTEFRNIGWASVSESINLAGVLTIFVAMSGLPATFVSSVAAVQPLAVLLLEKAAHSTFGDMVHDVKLLPKLGAIIFIVLGVVLLTIFGS